MVLMVMIGVECDQHNNDRDYAKCCQYVEVLNKITFKMIVLRG